MGKVVEMEMQREEKREEYAYVLDFLATGKAYSSRAEPLVQLIGDRWFTLLEASTKPNATLSIGEKVYIGSGDRDKISLIKERIPYSRLTQTAKNGLVNIVLKIINENESRFVDFFNNAQPLNIREHSLELLPGIGKKYLNAILKERAARKFDSFADIAKRVSLTQEPAMIIAMRVALELEGNERFYLFVKPYFPNAEHEHKYR